ncbi:hypothetical protein GDO81_025136 [Engystomops pustulosus]|uniref:Uncharacterized protein n=1 Tax=Engystomops pustulosus TaxID=76066 RepID=A0AAV6YK71_ENGPU|nr:hypothetical protein GDO81_025136 [Engystomops pustulosus]
MAAVLETLKPVQVPLFTILCASVYLLMVPVMSVTLIGCRHAPPPCSSERYQRLRTTCPGMPRGRFLLSSCCRFRSCSCLQVREACPGPKRSVRRCAGRWWRRTRPGRATRASARSSTCTAPPSARSSTSGRCSIPSQRDPGAAAPPSPPPATGSGEAPQIMRRNRIKMAAAARAGEVQVRKRSQ